MIVTIGEKRYVHISEFAQLIGRSVQAVRHLCLENGGLRRMKHIRDGSRILIEYSELTEYPFVSPGRRGAMVIYHYQLTQDGWERYECTACTTGENAAQCPEARRIYGV